MGTGNLSRTERDIMEVFWRNGAMKREQLAAHFAGNDWKSTTLLTFLSRLEKKGMLTIERQGKTNLYIPAVTAAAFLERESAQFLEQNFNGSVRDLVAAMADYRGITKEEIEELYAWLKEKENP